MRIDATSYADATRGVLQWAKKRESRYVCAANVHMVMEGYDSKDFCQIVNQSDLVTPDGMPLVWGLKALGIRSATRVKGPELTKLLLQAVGEEGIPVGFYGAGPEVLTQLLERIAVEYKCMPVAYACSPPFRSLSTEEDNRIVEEINSSGCGILFVGLGCPKQEQWMADHAGRINAVMLGVGAAFDFLAGTKAEAPHLMQAAGLEWLFRLAQEPGRLWSRYFRTNPRFVYLFARQLLGLPKLSREGACHDKE